MIKRWGAAIALALIALVGLGGPAHAAPSRATLAAAANAVAFETVGGSNYAKYQALYPTELDWSNDGCSVPSAILKFPNIGQVLATYKNIFEKSCDRHDFGYRNFGSRGALKLDPTEATRNRIDDRFYSNMRIQCQTRYDDWWDVPARQLCYGAAKTFYEAVDTFGKSAFYA